MVKKKDLIKVGYFVYFFLSFVIFCYRYEQVESDSCPFDFACIRFCCRDSELCTDFNETYFNKSLVSKQKFAEIAYLFGKPSCPSLHPLKAVVKWSFDFTGRIFLRNSSVNYAQNSYCLEKENNSHAGANAWDVFLCDEENRFRSIFYDCLMGVGLAFILATMIVHRQSNSLRALHGKCEFMFLFGMLMIHLAYPWKLEFHRFRRLLIRILYFGSMMTAFWKNVLIFDIYWSFRQRKWPEDELLRFTNYCYYAFGLIGAYLLVLLVEFVAWRSYALYTLLIFLAVTTSVEVVLLVLTSVNVFQTARSLRSADHKFFETERDRFQSYFVCFVVVSFSWYAELFFEWNIVSVFMVSFSAFLIFDHFAWMKLLNLSRKHEEKYNSAETVAL